MSVLSSRAPHDGGRRQLFDLRRQIEDLKRKAEPGSQQTQGEAGEDEIETMLRGAFPGDEINPVSQGIRGADIHHVVFDINRLELPAAEAPAQPVLVNFDR